ncbi:MAG: PEP-CTERM/exosortase system-associated acyltransferase [Pseudoxanthomonas sp.]|nr:PEP-CTERM/exosortase system-associated acyltransferase [Pseudoxanthomonas sp.]
MYTLTSKASGTDGKGLDFALDLRCVEVDPGEDIALLDEAYRLRHAVYCDQHKPLLEDRPADGLERDEFDGHARHFCVMDGRGEMVGYSRLVRATGADGVFPFHAYHAPRLAGVVLPPAAVSAEVSRMIVRPDYRRTRFERGHGAQAGAGLDERGSAWRRMASAQIQLSLFRQMYCHSLVQDIDFWFATMEKPWARALAQMHFRFRPISLEVNHFGPVVTYAAELREFERQVQAARPELFAWMQAPALERARSEAC